MTVSRMRASPLAIGLLTASLLATGPSATGLLVTQAHAAGVVEAGDIELGTDASAAAKDAKAALDKGDFAQAEGLYHALAGAGGGAAASLGEALAAYEAGDLRPARTAAEAVLAADPKNLAAANLLGLTLVDSGSVDAGLQALTAARSAAQSAGAAAMEARLTVNIGLAQLDQGDASAARESLSRGKALAEAAGDANTAAAAVQGLVAVDGLAGTDAGVGAALAKGQLKDARARATAHVQAATLTRDRIQAALDLAAVERAEGNLESAATRLQGAISEARRAGMMREVASGLGQLGLVYSLGGRMPIAADTLAAGVAEAAKGGYRVVEVDLRCELGITLVHLDRVDEAIEQQRATGVALAKMSYPQGVARQAELGGEIATAKGDLATATSALSQAVAYHEKLGHPLDAARVATRLSAAWQGTEPTQADKWGQKALSLYASAGEKLGPAHLALARALADARAKKLSEALRGFATAAEAAEAVGGGRAQAIADVARQDAAQTLVMLGAGQDVAKLAADQGVTDLMAREESMKTAFAAYEAGLASYGAGRYSAARDSFVAARQSFDSLGEPAYALRARRAAAWAQYNGAVAMPIAQAYPVYRAMLEESGKVEDPELQARVYGAVALGAVELKQGDPVGSLRGCADQAEKLGLVDLAARCHGALAERGTDLDERAREARTAASLDPANPSAVYALYSVAVDAYNAGRVDLAVPLATLAKAHAGTLAGAIDELLAAAQAP